MRMITEKLMKAIRNIIQYASQAGNDEAKWLDIAIQYDEIFDTQVTLDTIQMLITRLRDVMDLFDMFTIVLFDPQSGKIKMTNPPQPT